MGVSVSDATIPTTAEQNVRTRLESRTEDAFAEAARNEGLGPSPVIHVCIRFVGLPSTLAKSEIVLRPRIFNFLPIDKFLKTDYLDEAAWKTVSGKHHGQPPPEQQN